MSFVMTLKRKLGLCYWNTWYQQVLKLLTTCILSKTLKVRTNKTLILLTALYELKVQGKNVDCNCLEYWKKVALYMYGNILRNTSGPIFFYCYWGGTKSLALRPLLAYCTSPRWQVRVTVEQLVEWRLAGETEVLGENLPQRHFVHHKSQLTRPRPPRWEASD
jgi:hypothetical protein